MKICTVEWRSFWWRKEKIEMMEMMEKMEMMEMRRGGSKIRGRGVLL